MRARVALSILSASALFMMLGLGLGLARAQDEPTEPEVSPRPMPPQVPGPRVRRPGQKRLITPRFPPGSYPNNLPPEVPSNGPTVEPSMPPTDIPQAPPVPAPIEPPPGPTPPIPTPTPVPTPGAPGGVGAPPTFETGIEYQPTSPSTRVTFNLEDADLPDLVRLISNITGKRFILPGKQRSIKASVYAPTKVTAAEAYQAFLSILDLNGMTVVPSGRYLKIVESTGIENMPIPTYTEGSATPRDDRYFTRLYRVGNISAEDAAQLMARFKSREGNVTPYAPTNTIILTDTGANIRRMLGIIEAIDVPRTGEQVWIEPIHYANAGELAATLQEIYPVAQPGGVPGNMNVNMPPRPVAVPGTDGSTPQGPTTVGSSAGGGEARVTKILPDERTNSLIILATERAYLRILELIRQLDTPLEGEGRIHVHYIQHGDAEEIASTLSSLIGGSGGGGGGGGGGGAGGGRFQGMRNEARQQAAATAAGGGGDIFEGEIRVTAHVPANALVITSSLHDYAALRRVLDRLDAPRRQVFIEAVIMELSVDRSTQYGLRFHGGVTDVPEDGSLGVVGVNGVGSLTSLIADPNALQGLALGVQGPLIPDAQQLIGISVPAFGVVLTALANSGDANILSTPHIIALDNTEAEISVGRNVPLQTSGFTGLGSNLGGLTGLLGGQNTDQSAAGLAGLAGLTGGLGGFGSVPRQDVGTTLRITPHINDSDQIRLEIEEEISEAGNSTEGTLGVRSFSKRNAKTQLVVRDQQTVVIGGLMRDVLVNNQTKVPILGDIPLLGALFRQTTRTTEKTNLLLFLTPYIVRSPADLRSIFERKMRERQEFLDRYFVFGDHEYEPPLDYSRTRGLVAEIVNELKVLADEAQLLRDMEGRPAPDHVPRSPVGAAVDAARPPGESVITPETNDTDVIQDQMSYPQAPNNVPVPPPPPPPSTDPALGTP